MHVILDFDGTITVADSIDNLAAFAIAFQEERQRQESHQPGNSDVDWDARWKAIVDNYLADHQDHKAGYAPPEHARTTLAHELDFLRSLHSVDCRSIRRLRDAGLFAGLAPLPDRLFEAGRQAVAAAVEEESGDQGAKEGKDEKNEKDIVRLRPGFSEFLHETATRRQWPVSVVSVNWSDAWIRGVLGSTQDSTVQGHTGIRVFANKVTESGAIIPNFQRRETNGGSDHDDNVPFTSCSEKLGALETAVEHAAASLPKGGVNGHDPDAVVYMGDSTTDLECLVHAGRGSSGGGGIVLANGDGPETSKLIKTLKRLGYSVPHVSEADSFQRARTDEEDDVPRLAWARDFDEIMSSKILD